MGIKNTVRNPKGYVQNLKPIRSTEMAKRLGAKGGRANKNNPNARLAGKMRALKRKGLSDENAKHLMEVISEHDLSSLDVRIFLDSIRKDVKSSRDKINLGKSLIDWHKMTHGTKVRNENININIDIQPDVDKVVEHLRNLLGREE